MHKNSLATIRKNRRVIHYVIHLFTYKGVMEKWMMNKYFSFLLNFIQNIIILQKMKQRDITFFMKSDYNSPLYQKVKLLCYKPLKKSKAQTFQLNELPVAM